MLEKLKKALTPTPFKFFILLIFFLGFMLRLPMLTNLFIGGDNTRDVIISSVALERHELPLIGPFSSAGPFVTGPIYYWILMVGHILFPLGIYSLWAFFLVLSLVTLAGFTLVGYFLGGKRMSLITTLLGATSIITVNWSLNVSNPTLILITEIFLILFFILFFQKKKLKYAFLTGIFLGLAMNMHYQAINLLIFAPFTLLVRGISVRNRLLGAVLFALGFIIPLVPLFYWDSHQGFANINNILDYFLIAQYRIYVPNSWKIFLFQDMSYFMGNVIGGSKIAGFIVMFSLGFAFLLGIFKRKIKLPIFILFIIYFGLFLMNRFYHGQRSEGYLLYFLPFVIILVSWGFNLLLEILAKNKIRYLVYFVIVLAVFGNLLILRKIYKVQVSNLETFNTPIMDLQNRYPGEKFSLFDLKAKNGNLTFPLSLVMSDIGVQSPDGIKVAVNCVPEVVCDDSEAVTRIGGLPVVNLSGVSDSEIKKEYAEMNREAVYDDLIGWSKKHELRSNFSLKKYLLE